MFATQIRNLIFPAVCWLGMFLLTCLPQFGLSQLLKDGSFELQPSSTQSEYGWTTCVGDPDLQVLDGHGPGIFGINTPPSHGQRYLGLVATDQGFSESVGQPAILEAGMHHYGSVDLFRSMAHQSWNGIGQIQLWGGNGCTTATELLWSSGSIANVDAWRTYPFSFTPVANHTWLSVVLALDLGSGELTYVCMDNLQLVNEFFAVDFLGLEAIPQAETVVLQWETVALEDDLRFDVEWSTDGQDFHKVGAVEAHASESHFEYQHASAQLGLQFYRIKSVDQGGHENLSEVRQVVLAGASVQVFPNPVRFADGQLTVSAGEEIQALRLLELSGRLLQEVAGSGSEQMGMDLPVLTPGCYLLQVQVKGSKSTHRVLVQ